MIEEIIIVIAVSGSVVPGGGRTDDTCPLARMHARTIRSVTVDGTGLESCVIHELFTTDDPYAAVESLSVLHSKVSQVHSEGFGVSIGRGRGVDGHGGGCPLLGPEVVGMGLL